MYLTYIDIETTDLVKTINQRRVYPDIVSCAYLTVNENWERVESGILYFDDEAMETSTSSAYSVHRLSREFLRQHRGSFSDNMRKLYKLISRGNLVGHKAKLFDAPVIIKFLEKYDYSNFAIANVFDTLDGMRAYMKFTFVKTEADKRLKRGSATLSNICLQLKITDSIVDTFYKRYFPEDVVESRAHNAGTDIIRTYFVHRFALRNKLMELNV